MTKSEYKNAFSEVITLEYVDIPADDNMIDYTFSNEFLNHMDKLLLRQKKIIWNIINVVRRNVAMVAIVSLTVFASACGITEIINYLNSDLYQRFPISKEVVEIAMEKVDLPNDLMIQENELLVNILQIENGIDGKEFTLLRSTKDLYDGKCMNVISHKSEESIVLGLELFSIDQEEYCTEKELEQAIRFATYLFWQDESETRVYDIFMKEYVEGEKIYLEDKIDGIQYQIAYLPDSEGAKFKIKFKVVF